MKRGILSRGALICLALVLLVSVLGAGCTTKPTAPTLTSTPTPTPTSTPAAAPVSFAGKTITIIVGVTAGGSTDIMGRVFAKFLSKYLPGNPTIIVRNMPGAEGTIGANYFYLQKPDGLTLYTAGGGIVTAGLLKKKVLKFDVLEMTGVVAFARSATWYAKPNIIDRPEDIRKAKGIIFGGAAGSATALIFLMAKEMLEFPLDKAVFAYSGGSEARRAFVAGEVSVVGGSTSTYSTDIKPLLEKGEAKMLFQSGLLDKSGNIVRHSTVPDVITVDELYQKLYGKSPSGMAYEAFRAFLAASESLANLLFLPPKTPDNIVRAYWDAAEKILKDPEFVKLIAPVTGEGVEWVAGDVVDQRFHKEFRLRPEVLTWLTDLLRTKYGMVLD